MKCTRCFHEMRKINIIGLIPKWVCLDCGMVIK